MARDITIGTNLSIIVLSFSLLTFCALPQQSDLVAMSKERVAYYVKQIEALYLEGYEATENFFNLPDDVDHVSTKREYRLVMINLSARAETLYETAKRDVNLITSDLAFILNLGKSLIAII